MRGGWGMKYRDWLMLVIAGKVLIQTVCELDRNEAERIASELGVIPHWHAKPVDSKAPPAFPRREREKPIIGHVLNLSSKAGGPNGTST